MSEPPDKFEPISLSERVMIGPSPEIMALLLSKGAPYAEYRGTDLATGDEYWQMAEAPISFVVRPSTKQIIVWHMGSDPDRQ